MASRPACWWDSKVRRTGSSTVWSTIPSFCGALRRRARRWGPDAVFDWWNSPGDRRSQPSVRADSALAGDRRGISDASRVSRAVRGGIPARIRTPQRAARAVRIREHPAAARPAGSGSHPAAHQHREHPRHPVRWILLLLLLLLLLLIRVGLAAVSSICVTLILVVLHTAHRWRRRGWRGRVGVEAFGRRRRSA